MAPSDEELVQMHSDRIQELFQVARRYKMMFLLHPRLKDIMEEEGEYAEAYLSNLPLPPRVVPVRLMFVCFFSIIYWLFRTSIRALQHLGSLIYPS